MNKGKIARLHRKLGKLRARKRNVRPRDLTRFAGTLGRRRDTLRGSEPQWVSDLLPDSRPISIPSHPTINPYTAESIMDRFEEDLDKFSEIAEKEERRAREEPKRLSSRAVRTNRNTN